MPKKLDVVVQFFMLSNLRKLPEIEVNYLVYNEIVLILLTLLM